LVNSETITLKEEVEQTIRESRQYVFQIDHEAIMNGIKKGTDFIDFDEFLDFEVFKFFKEGDENYHFFYQELLNIMYARVDGYNWFNDSTGIFSYKGLSEAVFSIEGTTALYHVLLTHPSFPFGFRQPVYDRHKKIMLKRYADIKSKMLIPPNFKDGSNFGLSEMKEYLNDKSRRGISPRPKVKGKTFFLSYSSPKMIEDHENGREFKANSYTTMYFREVDFNKEYITNVTFMNYFDNVVHPLHYFLDIKYKHFKEGNEKLDYGWHSIKSLTRALINMGDGYEYWDEKLSYYDIVCFNLFELPLRGLVIETVMKFLLIFQKKHPNIYIKDVSGLGYYPYKDYPFYEELLASKIDVGI